MSKKKTNQLKALILALRPGQWIKNFLVFAAVIFNEKLFYPFLLRRTIEGFLVFCVLSSASYLLNDIIDEPLDKKHPAKKTRPIASGALPKSLAFEVMIILSIIGLVGAFSIRLSFFAVSAGFFLLHVLYSFYLKKFAILDILSISLSFVLRAFAGEVLTGFHLPVWLMFTVIFLSLFIAASKRRSELVTKGDKARPALGDYREKLLDFYVSTFATAAILAYAMFAFVQGVPSGSEGILAPMLSQFIPGILARKWLMAITVPLVIVGIMRYAQLIYERALGEAPEKLLTSDWPLVATLFAWGISVVFIIYII